METVDKEIKPEPMTTSASHTKQMIKKEISDAAPLIGITAHSLVQRMKSKRTKSPQELLPKWLSIIKRQLLALVRDGEMVTSLYIVGSCFSVDGQAFTPSEARFLVKCINENQSIEGFHAKNPYENNIKIAWEGQ